MSRILIIDDERSMVDFLLILLKKAGHTAQGVTEMDEALRLIDEQAYELVITDLRIRDRSGLDVLRRAKEKDPSCEVIMITAYATAENAVEAMKLGAYDYITKPFNVEEFRALVDKALEKRFLREENATLRERLGAREAYGEVVGKSESMRKIFDLVDRIKDARANVLVTGESGTGKEIVARALHQHSGRRGGPFVAVNCGALPENLIESELFGYRKGAFTGATADRAGLFEAADRGTLFLDELGEVPQPLQVKLLRVLQERTVRRVGGTQDIAVDVRIVAATNRDLAEEVREGRFREDLYFRLNVLHVHIPPLRERRADILVLAHHFLRKHCREMGRADEGFTEACAEHLEAYAYPGNVRELENIVERAVALTSNGPIDVESLPPNVLDRPAPTGALPALDGGGVNLEHLIEGLERDYLARALELSGGSKTKAAELLGMSFRSFRYKLDKYGLK